MTIDPRRGFSCCDATSGGVAVPSLRSNLCKQQSSCSHLLDFYDARGGLLLSPLPLHHKVGGSSEGAERDTQPAGDGEEEAGYTRTPLHSVARFHRPGVAAETKYPSFPLVGREPNAWATAIQGARQAFPLSKTRGGESMPRHHRRKHAAEKRTLYPPPPPPRPAIKDLMDMSTRWGSRDTLVVAPRFVYPFPATIPCDSCCCCCCPSALYFAGHRCPPPPKTCFFYLRTFGSMACFHRPPPQARPLEYSWPHLLPSSSSFLALVTSTCSRRSPSSGLCMVRIHLLFSSAFIEATLSISHLILSTKTCLAIQAGGARLRFARSVVYTTQLSGPAWLCCRCHATSLCAVPKSPLSSPAGATFFASKHTTKYLAFTRFPHGYKNPSLLLGVGLEPCLL